MLVTHPAIQVCVKLDDLFNIRLLEPYWYGILALRRGEQVL
jgi:hypothetical protein